MDCFIVNQSLQILMAVFLMCLLTYLLAAYDEALNPTYSLISRHENHETSTQVGKRAPPSKNSVLHVQPHDLDHCATLRVRSLGPNLDHYDPLSQGTTSVLTQLQSVLQKHQERFEEQHQGHGNVRMEIPLGMIFVEDPGGFTSLGKPGVLHLYHFLEFLLIAFAEWHNLAQSLKKEIRTKPHDHNILINADMPLEWIQVPLMTRDEICGVGEGLNCFLLEFLFWPNEEIGHKHGNTTRIYGLESNHINTTLLHPGYQGVLKKRTGFEGAEEKLQQSLDAAFAQVQTQNAANISAMSAQSEIHQEMTTRADAVLLVDRPSCQRNQRVNIHKIFTNYVGHFPAQAWHDRVQEGLRRATRENSKSTTPSKIQVCYIDRQNTKRRLPSFFHDWLLEYVGNHDEMDLLHLHMEQFEPLDQVRVASTCQVMMGGHGNGLSHSVWMKPKSFVVEFFFRYSFQYDYASLAQLMDHRYFTLFEGTLPSFETNISKIHNQSQSVVGQAQGKYKKKTFSEDSKKIQRGQAALVSFLEQAIQERRQSSGAQ
mmetsp:Transcript_5899/g.12422  ORF Transcript_5899/g.12422 Transcript_5899/m.12422 type:complete len:540 (-) Transcript_5899:753-2372(-)